MQIINTNQTIKKHTFKAKGLLCAVAVMLGCILCAALFLLPKTETACAKEITDNDFSITSRYGDFHYVFPEFPTAPRYDSTDSNSAMEFTSLVITHRVEETEFINTTEITDSAVFFSNYSNKLVELDYYELDQNYINLFTYSVTYTMPSDNTKTLIINSRVIPFEYTYMNSGDSDSVTVSVKKASTPVLSYDVETRVINIDKGANYRSTNLYVGLYPSVFKTFENVGSSLSADDLVSLPNSVEFKVWAVNTPSDNNLASDESNKLTLKNHFKYDLKCNGSVVTWTSCCDEKEFIVYLGEENYFTKFSVTGNSFDVRDTTYKVGFHGLWIRSVDSSVDITVSSSDVLPFAFSPLARPIIRVESGIIKWDAVPKAAGYRVYYNDSHKDIAETQISIQDLITVPGDYTFKVRAIGNLKNTETLTMENVSTFVSPMVAINYSVNGDITTKLLEYGSAVELPSVSLKDKVFAGWYYDAEYKTAVAEGDKVENTLTIYAKFTDAQVSGTTTKWYDSLWTNYKWWIIGGSAVLVVLLISGITVAVKRRSSHV